MHQKPFWRNVNREFSQFALRLAQKEYEKAKHLKEECEPCTNVFQRRWVYDVRICLEIASIKI